MNTHIKELYAQAYESVVNHTPSFLVTSEMINQKFAELIVRKCLNKIENEAAQYAEPVWAFELVNDIKEHFGVEL